MLKKLITSLFGDKHGRYIKKIQPIVDSINEFYESYKDISEQELQNKTLEFKKRLEEGQTLDDLLPEAFAVVKETCRRMLGKSWKVAGHESEWNMIPYDEQLIGGIALHQGKIAEMATGEGKTLVAVLPTYLNALIGKGVHIVTVNDYLAERDSQWMGQIYNFLGLTVGCILNDMDNDERRNIYAKDVIYGTNNEFGFDYLRDNMAIDKEEKVQREFYYAIVDEVDSVLIDEARTPLIISGPVNESTNKRFEELNPVIKRLFEKQNYLNNKLITETKQLLNTGKNDEKTNSEIGKKLLQAKLGGPKNKQLLKLFNEPGMKRLCDTTENIYLRDKILHHIEELNFFNINEKNGSADLTDKGRDVLAQAYGDSDLFVLPDLSDELVKIDNDDTISEVDKLKKKEDLHKSYTEKNSRIHIISQLLRAYSLFEKDVEYMVQDGRVIIIDEHTGRPMEGRRYSDGLHQAIEAKEKVKVERESQTLATITLQNYFRMYDKLAGMTGTAETEEHEFWEIYKLDVVVIPTHDKVRRVDHNDIIYKTKREKYKAIIREIKELHEEGRPVLVGTINVDVSQLLSSMLKRQGIKCNVLNAKNHKNEAEIVAQAGKKSAVTIATNMAGRGTDIKLGSGVVKYNDDEKTKENAEGGLFILGTERHEARRIDRQLRGRAGRQGDPGDSQFYLSLEDDLMRLFGSDRITNIMDRLGMKEDEPIAHPWITKSVEKAQKRVEGRNFDIRKHLLEYDNVMNIMRTEVYKKRNSVLNGDDTDPLLNNMIEEYIEDIILTFTNEADPPSEWDWDGLNSELIKTLTIQIDTPDKIDQEELLNIIEKTALTKLEENKNLIDNVENDLFEKVKRIHILRTIDDMWKEHLYNMDCLREGINLRAYGQKDPLMEYKKEGFALFDQLLKKINEVALERIFNTSFSVEDEDNNHNKQKIRYKKDETSAMNLSAGQGAPQRENVKKKPIKRTEKKVKPNELCPCGSGKKYKKCCGA